MPTYPKIVYEFGPFRVDPDKQTLFRDLQPVPITSKAFETLLVLLRNGNEVVSKENLMQALWPDTVVEESNLSQNIFMLRKALGDTPEDRRYILTLPGRGYRFVSEVRIAGPNTESIMIASRTRSRVTIEETEQESETVSKGLPASALTKVRSSKYVALALIAGFLALGAAVIARRNRPDPLGEKDSILIADFLNKTGDPVFDDTLRRGLIVQLEQSPFLSLVPEDRIRHTLQLMALPEESVITADIARQVCVRTSSTAVLDGTIEVVGTQYVIGLRARNCQNGGVLDEEQVQAARKEDVLSALTQIAGRFRRRIGESLETMQQHDTPLADATTPSLDALKAYSTGWKVILSSGDTAAVPFFERAIQLDPQFALAYASLGRVYGDLGEAALSAQNSSKAYELRYRASDEEKFWITATYQTQVTENLAEARQTCLVWQLAYPRDPMPPSYLAGVIDPVLGRYEEALEEAKKVRDVDPDFAIAYFLLSWRYQELGRFREADDALQQATARKLEIPDFALARYRLAFLRGVGASTNQAGLSTDQNPLNEWLANERSSILAYSGNMQQSIVEAQHASALAEHEGHREAAALYLDAAAIAAGFVEARNDAIQLANSALKLSSDRGVEYGAALALALAGDSLRSQHLAHDLVERFPEDASVQFSYFPTLQAQILMNRGDAAHALEILEKATPYELGEPRTALHANFGALYPIYVRGEVLLSLRRNTDAAVEFRKILDHPGITGSDPIGALARVELARAYAASGRKVDAKSCYETFFRLWKDADPASPILNQAKAEYAKLLTNS